MKDWTVTDSYAMHNSYEEKTLKGIGDPVGYNVRIKAIRNIQIDVWGHGEGKEETERIGSMIIALPALIEEINQLKLALLMYRGADVKSSMENSILTNEQLEFINPLLLKATELEKV